MFSHMAFERIRHQEPALYTPAFKSTIIYYYTNMFQPILHGHAREALFQKPY